MTDPIARPHLEMASGPFLHRELSTPRVMWEVFGAALVVVGAALWNFGVGAALIVLAATAGAVLPEWLVWRRVRSAAGPHDGSAALTGVLLGLTLPPATPVWMAFLGGLVAMALGKLIWGGLGTNVFNPALVGRAFLQAAFPTALTTWTPPTSDRLAIPPTVLAPPFAHVDVDLVTAASPLGLAKFDHKFTDIAHLWWGHTAGSLGETSAAVLVVVGLWLAWRRAFDWRLPVATLGSAAVLAAVFHALAPATYPSAGFTVLSGGLLFGAVFMVTDPVTTPVGPAGAWVFGAGVGLLAVMIRFWGGLPEGVMYAILLMNAVTPLLDRVTQPRPYGMRRRLWRRTRRGRRHAA